MDTDLDAEKNFEYAPMCWVISYFLSGVVFLQHLDHLWMVRTRPTDVLGMVFGALTLIYSFLPVLIGRAFRRRLKNGLANGSLTLQTFRSCDWGIAQLVFFAYLGMLLFGMRY
jgi:hypothetical protein